MDIQLERLAHQDEAVEKILRAFENYGNRPDGERRYAAPCANPDIAGGVIDVKMETGTGKTCVYTRLMLELCQKFGVYKFVLLVPSLPIKEGAKSFLDRKNGKIRKLRELYGYDCDLDLCAIDSGDFGQKRKSLPTGLVEYLNAGRYERGGVKCLLLNSQMLTGSSMSADDYDQDMFLSAKTPLNAIAATKPVVIIDEPHKFRRGNAAWNAMLELEPQMIVRFGATFPLKNDGRPDYENLVYDLTAVRAFNEGLVKGVTVQYPDMSLEQAENFYTVRGATATTLTLQAADGRISDCEINEPIPGFNGLSYIGRKDEQYRLSNGLSPANGMKLIPGIFSDTYQELMINQALESHFAQERENFTAFPAKIKTLTLFFIDDIDAFRKPDGWLKQAFDRCLTAQLTKRIKSETNNEYKSFLQASLDNLSETRGGYFAEDKKSEKGRFGEDKERAAIQAEVDDILKNKEKLISFKDEFGNWILRRFLFSKWTLKEGWDNPNVFVIAKLRTSGSETSKIQEVGRGLRLPVDEYGRRLGDREFRLDYIVDWSEREFAEKLCADVNASSGVSETAVLTDEILAALVENEQAENAANAKGLLLCRGIIDIHDKIVDPGKLLALLPQNRKLKEGLVTTGQCGTAETIKLRKGNWEKLKELWRKVTKRYMLEFNDVSDDDLLKIAEKAVNGGKAFQNAVGQIVRSELTRDGDGALQIRETLVATDVPPERIPYGVFLKRLTKNTGVGAAIWHRALCSECPGGIDPAKFHHISLENIVCGFRQIFAGEFCQKFKYSELDFTADTSLMKNSEFVDEIKLGFLGWQSEPARSEKYLYDKIAYDSQPEREILGVEDDNVVVFGKLPKKSIKVPKYTGGTTSPDFVYAVQTGGGVELRLFIEAKPTAEGQRQTDKEALVSQQKFFEAVPGGVEWRKVSSEAEVLQILSEMERR